MDNISIDVIISNITAGKYLDINEVRFIFDKSSQVFSSEPNVLKLSPPIIVAGDTHGQLEDVIHMFELTSNQPQRYLFLGDYVDRGPFSIELFCLLLCYKCKRPNDFFMLRGNHETKEVNSEYGFSEELLAKYGVDGNAIWNKCNSVFEMLPLAAVIDNKIFCVHGGITPELSYLSQIMEYQRRTQPDLKSIVGNMLWSDPGNVEEYQRSERRSGYLFGEKHVQKFLENNGLQKIVRSHEMADGYEVKFNGKLITVWSAPNYCFVCGNKASVLVVKEDGSEEFIVYEAMPDERRFQPHSSFSMISYFQ